MDKTLAIGWFLTGALLVLLWQTQTEPRRKNRKTEPNNLARDDKTLYPDLSKSMKQSEQGTG